MQKFALKLLSTNLFFWRCRRHTPLWIQVFSYKFPSHVYKASHTRHHHHSTTRNSVTNNQNWYVFIKKMKRTEESNLHINTLIFFFLLVFCINIFAVLARNIVVEKTYYILQKYISRARWWKTSNARDRVADVKSHYRNYFTACARAHK